jgi:hypothetical protein
MDTSADRNRLDMNRTDPLLAVLHTLLGLVRRAIGFFVLTEEDKLKAGIYTSSQGRDR